jgi:hypothetical protein
MAGKLETFIDPDEIQKIYQTHTVEHYNDIFGQGDLPYFKGMYVQQRGQGVLGDLLRTYALPALTRAAPYVFKGVKKVIQDVTRGRPLKSSVKKRAPKALKRAGRAMLGGKCVTKRKPLKTKNQEKFQFPLLMS